MHVQIINPKTMKNHYFASVLMFLSSMLFTNSSYAQSDFDVVLNPSNYGGGYNISCNGAQNGSVNLVVVGGDAPFSYSWSNGATTKNIAGLAAGNYTVTVTSASNIIRYFDVELIQPIALGLTIQANHVTEEGASNGSIESSVQGGNPPYRYVWSNGSHEEGISNLAAGVYTLTVFDYSNCIVSSTVQVNEPGPLSITSISSPTFTGGYNVSCQKATDGSASVTVSGGIPPYTYQWSNGAYTKDVYDLGAGDYSVLITDEGGASTEAYIYIAEPASLQLNFTTTQISCYNCNNGSITASVTGGVGPFTYLWEDGVYGATRNDLSPGEYSVFVSNNYGCSTSGSKLIFQPQQDSWAKEGNAGTDPSTSFIGTTDSVDFVMRTNNIERLRITNDGDLKIPTLAGTQKRNLEVDENGKIIAVPSIPDETWLTTGNTALPNGSYLGTIYQQAFNIRTHADHVSLPRMTFTAHGFGYIGISETTPANMLVINSSEKLPVSSALDQRMLDFGDMNLSDIYFDAEGEMQTPPTIAHNEIGISALQLVNSNTQNTKTDGFTIGQLGSHTYMKNHETNSGITVQAPAGIALNATAGNLAFNAAGRTRLATHGLIFRNLSTSENIIFQNGTTTHMTLRPNGQVLIGTNESVTGYILAVRGKIRAEEIKVDIDTWPDYVFEENYELKSINELEKFVKVNKHLPGIPSATEIEQEGGLSVGEMQRLQMQKIEELTLYIIELQKQLDEVRVVAQKPTSKRNRKS